MHPTIETQPASWRRTAMWCGLGLLSCIAIGLLVFYKTLLPDLRARGKLVVVITHDDRYFHLGNQVIKLEDGKVVEYLKTEVGGR